MRPPAPARRARRAPGRRHASASVAAARPDHAARPVVIAPPVPAPARPRFATAPSRRSRRFHRRRRSQTARGGCRECPGPRWQPPADDEAAPAHSNKMAFTGGGSAAQNVPLRLSGPGRCQMDARQQTAGGSPRRVARPSRRGAPAARTAAARVAPSAANAAADRPGRDRGSRVGAPAETDTLGRAPLHRALPVALAPKVGRAPSVVGPDPDRREPGGPDDERGDRDGRACRQRRRPRGGAGATARAATTGATADPSAIGDGRAGASRLLWRGPAGCAAARRGC